MVRAAAFDRHMAASLGVPVQLRLCRHLRLRRRACRASPACCWRRSTRCSRPWAATSSCSPSRSSSSAAWARSRAPWSPACCSPRCRPSPASSSRRSGPTRSCSAIMVLVLMFRPQGLFGTARPWLTRLDPWRCAPAMCSTAVLVVLAALALARVRRRASGDTFYLRLATEALIFAGLALSVDILLGYTGLLSLGQALYFGIGAYVSALVLMHVPVVLGGDGRERRRGAVARSDRRAHRHPRARRLFRADHLWPGPGRWPRSSTTRASSAPRTA